MKRLHISDLRDALAMLALFAIMTLAVSLAIMGCGSDEPGGGGSAGTTATGGMGGTGGTGGEGGTSTGGTSATGGTAGEGGTPGNVWKKGVIGKAGVPRVIMQNGGPILGISLRDPMLRTLDGELDGGASDAEVDAGLPGVIPKVEFANPPAGDFVIITPPYQRLVNGIFEPAEPPYTVTYKPDGEILFDQHFNDWQQSLNMGCYGPYPVTVNGQDLSAFSGVTFDIEVRLDRQYFVTTASDCLYELMPNGLSEKRACGFDNPSSLLVHPQGFLVVTTLPGYVMNAPLSVPQLPVKIFKILADEPYTVTEIASLPIPANYATTQSVTTCPVPWNQYVMPSGQRIPFALFNDGNYAVGDVGARTIYKVSADGSSITEFATLDLLVAELILAPNDVLYAVTAPLLGDKLDGNGATVIKGVVIKAWDIVTQTWIDIAELSGYEPYANNMSNGNNAVSCPDEFAEQGLAHCLLPEGVYLKVVPDVTPLLFVSDPITARLFEIPLDMNEEELDAGVPEAGDDADTGTAGSSGVAGSAGTNGTSGSAGSAPQSAPYPPAEAPAHEPMAETPENTSPWVWFALLGALGAATLAGLGLRRR